MSSEELYRDVKSEFENSGRFHEVEQKGWISADQLEEGDYNFLQGEEYGEPSLDYSESKFRYDEGGIVVLREDKSEVTAHIGTTCSTTEELRVEQNGDTYIAGKNHVPRSVDKEINSIEDINLDEIGRTLEKINPLLKN